jgi:Cu/Ag efflux pump CusA
VTCTALTLVLLPILYKRFGERTVETLPTTHA